MPDDLRTRVLRDRLLVCITERRLAVDSKPMRTWTVLDTADWICGIGCNYYRYRNNIIDHGLYGPIVVYLITTRQLDTYLVRLGIHRGLHHCVICAQLKHRLDND
jgi:hypothetical protein